MRDRLAIAAARCRYRSDVSDEERRMSMLKLLLDFKA